MLFSSLKILECGKPILVFGSNGQIGKSLRDYLKDLQVPAIFLGRSDCDLSNESAIVAVLNRYRPQVIINAAAYTDVDKAESEHDLAFAINSKAPAVMAHYIANHAHGVFVHYSSDYVFGDTKTSDYLETDTTGPADRLGIYGLSKLAGEEAITKIFNLANDIKYVTDADKISRYYILRTSWVYGEGDNFIRTVLRLASQRNQLKMVVDQVGVPTSARWLAEVGLEMAGSMAESGIYHAVPDGETSWHGLAIFAIEMAMSAGWHVEVKPGNIQPIPATHYSSVGRRPYNSRLNHDKLRKTLAEMAFIGEYPCWKRQVEAYVKEYVKKSLQH